MTNVNTVKSSEVLTEQIAELEFYKNQLHEIIENKYKHPVEYVEKTRELIKRTEQALKESYVQLGAVALREEILKDGLLGERA